MNYWRRLECINYNDINKEILAWIESQAEITNTNSFWNPVDIKELIHACPKFQAWLIEQNLRIKTVAVTYGKTVECCGIHIDAPPARYKLSWPVKNTAGTWNRWFDDTGDSVKYINHLGGVSFNDSSKLKEITRRELLAPCIIDAGVPHDVWFKDIYTTAFPRIGLQCQLFHEPDSL